MLDITLIPKEVKQFAEQAGIVTTTIEKDLQSGIITDLAALIPGGGQLQADMILACNTAIVACRAVAGIANSPALQAILQRLGADLVRLQHTGGTHTTSWYVRAFEEVFNDLFGKAA